MLNKEICKLCCNNHSPSKWNEYDETYWKENTIYCPIEISKKIGREYNKNTNLHIPKWCFYKMEHLILEDNCVKE